MKIHSDQHTQINKMLDDGSYRFNDEKLLEKNGWSVDCWSPFEISKEDPSGGKTSRATGDGAQYVLIALRYLNRKLGPKYKSKDK